MRWLISCVDRRMLKHARTDGQVGIYMYTHPSTYLTQDGPVVRGGWERLTGRGQGPGEEEAGDGSAVGNVVGDAVCVVFGVLFMLVGCLVGVWRYIHNVWPT